MTYGNYLVELYLIFIIVERVWYECETVVGACSQYCWFGRNSIVRHSLKFDTFGGSLIVTKMRQSLTQVLPVDSLVVKQARADGK